MDGPIVAPATVPPDAWARVLPAAAAPFVLAPGSDRGWFGGTSVVAWSPAESVRRVDVCEAAAMLERSFAGGRPSVTVALLPYDGEAVAARYEAGLVWTPEGWRAWGALDPSQVPDVGAALREPVPAGVCLVDDVRSDLSEQAFRSGVEIVREAIRAGDYYVLNLTRRLTGTPVTGPATAFASLVARTQADMAALWLGPGAGLVSVSPERFVRMAGRGVEVCPIKGTRPRAAGDADAVMAAELSASVKERAEHVMIVDMERNDLGRVCRPGTVKVDPLFEVIATPYCHQMVSSVRGELRDGATIADLLEAVHPCGSVTGAPKVAAMRAIAALEASPRGAYTGSLVVALPGELDSSVLIRTAEYDGGAVRWGTGGGITVDSDPGEEWLETELKASPFLGNGPYARR